MNKTFLVFKQELISTVKRKSFLIMLVLLPAIGFIITFLVGGFGQNEQTQQITQLLSSPQGPKIYGLIDKSGLVKDIPEVYENNLVLYPEEQSAEEALKNNDIEGFFIVSQDYLATGNIILVRLDNNPLSGLDQSGSIEYLLNQAILGSDQSPLVNRVLQPMNLNVDVLSPDEQRNPETPLTFFLPYVVTLLFYFVIMGSSSLMLNSITNEKTNRVIEMLMTSITPRQMLFGKITALGLVGLFQTIVWAGSGYLLLRLSGRAINLSSAFQLSPTILLWGILFFILGYAFYASLMAGVGALVPNLREASQATTIMVIPMIIPMMFIGPLSEDPNSLLAIIISLFPFTAPVTIMTRLAAGTIPVWQIILAAVLLIISIYFIVRAVSGLFRAQNLLSGQAFNLKRFARALSGKN